MTLEESEETRTDRMIRGGSVGRALDKNTGGSPSF